MTDAPSCSRCQSTGPALLPARYAVVPDGISASIPGWATPQTAFPKGEGYSYWTSRKSTTTTSWKAGSPLPGPPHSGSRVPP